MMDYIEAPERMPASVTWFKTQQKPDTEEMHFIQRTLLEDDSYQCLTPEELAIELTGPEGGSTFSPGIFDYAKELVDGKMTSTLRRSTLHWIGQWYFAIDIDNNLNFNQFIARAEKYNILPVFVYDTFSNPDALNPTKYRAVFASDQAVRIPQLFHIMQRSLMTIFQEADQSCKDRSRMYYGGKNIIYSNFSARINPDELVTQTCTYLHNMNRDSGNISRSIKKYCRDIGLNYRGKLPDIIEVDREELENMPQIDEFAPQTYNIYVIGKGRQVVKFALYDPTNPKRNLGQPKIPLKEDKHTSGEDLMDACRLWHDFKQDAYSSNINHEHRWGLASNVYLIRGGEKIFLESINSRFPDKGKDWEVQFGFLRQKAMRPQNCDNYCPFTDECNHANNILNTVKGNIVRVIEIPKIKSIVEAEDQLRKTIFAPHTKGSMQFIKSSTGIGKTKLAVEYILEHDCKGITLACPTHELKDEVIERIKTAGGNVMSTPKLPEIPDEKQRLELERYFSAGLYTHAHALIERLARKNQQIDRYLNELKEVEYSEKAIVTTHAKMLTLRNSLRPVLIIDEDPTATLLQQRYTTLNELQKVAEIAKSRKLNQYLGSLVHNDTAITNIGRAFSQREIHYLMDKIAKFGISSNVLGLLHSDYYISQNGYIHFITKKTLPDYENIKILSATIDFNLMEDIFSLFSKWNWTKNVDFVDISNVQLRGTLKQYVSRATSRNALATPGRLDRIKRRIPEGDVILSFLAYENEFENSGGHFGALEGLDIHRGKNISIVGTPHTTVMNYRLQYAFLTKNSTQPDLTMSMLPVERNGLSFRFYTFNDLLMQKIQLHAIESELMQSIGRARLTRTDATVTVFSNYPIPGASFIYDNLRN